MLREPNLLPEFVRHERLAWDARAFRAPGWRGYTPLVGLELR